jgi:hypothetical protein
MERIHKIWEHPLYQEQFQLLQDAESDRIFCRHTLEHFLDVARLTYISSLEAQADYPKVLIYATALLHDIGRYGQIAHGIPHEQAGAELAGRIMADCGFLPEEIQEVQAAILSHRGSRTSAAADTQNCSLTDSAANMKNCSSTDHAAKAQICTLAGDATDTQKPALAGDVVDTHGSGTAAWDFRSTWSLSTQLAAADKHSRCCFACPAASECNWSPEKKNLQILI